MLNGAKEQELVDALRSAEQSGDAAAIESAVNGLALWFSVTERFEAAAPYWRRGVELLARSTAPNSRELGTYLHNMAAMCLIPAGLHDEARRTLMRAKEICAECFPGDAEMQRGVDELLKGIGR